MNASTTRPRLVRLMPVAIFLMCGTLASAATITYGPTLHDNGGAGYGNGMVDSFMLPQFDDLGGTFSLTKVTLTVKIDGTGGAHDFDNESGSGATITLGIGSQVRVKGPVPGIGSQIVVNPDATMTVTGSITADTDGAADFAGTDWLGIVGGMVTDTRSASKTSAFDTAPYVGTGNVTFTVDGGTSTTGTSALPSPGANMVTFGSTNFDYTVTLVYEYVPEPSTYVLFAIGAAAVLVHARRRKAAK